MEPPKINIIKTPGMLALAVFLLLFGLMVVIPALGSVLHILTGIAALVAGALILIGK
jgi:hypothetical protein